MSSLSTTQATQPAGGAVLHLLSDVAPELDPLLLPWWDVHVRELLTLPGFVSARRAQQLTPGAPGRHLAVYRLETAIAADQPRPEHFATLPAELEGKVVFRRRVLVRADAPPAAEPVGTGVLQLIREPADPASLAAVAARVRTWPGVLGVSTWSNAAAVDFHRRSDVVQLGDSDLLLAELAAPSADLTAQAGRELPDWEAQAYTHTFPDHGVLLP